MPGKWGEFLTATEPEGYSSPWMRAKTRIFFGGVDEAFAGAADLENIGSGDFCISVAQRAVVFRAGKYERRHQRAGADAGNDKIIRPFARLG